MDKVTVIGAGLAGCEAAWRLAKTGVPTRLFEMRPVRMTPAHKTGLFAELVCSNSLKADGTASAVGVLKAEMQALGSIVISAARGSAVPAGGALAVDREAFAAFITREIEGRPEIEIVREEVTTIPDTGIVVIAAGPLASDALSSEISRLSGEGLFFYDAIAPIVSADSIDMSIAFAASRYDKGGADYVNCPMGRDEYEAFIDALLSARRTPLREFEQPRFFEGCLPIEEMAERGRDTPAHGPMKPVGLVDPRTGRRPYAVVQLRREDAHGALYNLVGFQTRLAHPEQERVFRMIPGLARAEFARLGSVHRNTYINSPALLDPTLALRANPRILFAGQLTGVEGYNASAASGIVAGINAARAARGLPLLTVPSTTVTGALLAYVSDPQRTDFQPINPNFGILDPLPDRVKKSQRKQALAERALADIQTFAREMES